MNTQTSGVKYPQKRRNCRPRKDHPEQPGAQWSLRDNQVPAGPGHPSGSRCRVPAGPTPLPLSSRPAWPAQSGAGAAAVTSHTPCARAVTAERRGTPARGTARPGHHGRDTTAGTPRPGSPRSPPAEGARQEEEWRRRNRSAVGYIAAAAVGMVGLSYAAVPLYRLYCQATGLGGTAGTGGGAERIERMEPVRDRRIRVTFNADTHASIQWNFKPQQSEIWVVPGETALAFYKAKNPTDKPIIGISTYNVVPFEAGQYFNKIQCFCFEEQRLNPQEEVDMPVFFYIDPEFAEDPKMAKVDLITLSYTFFEAKEGQKLPLPGYQ